MLVIVFVAPLCHWWKAAPSVDQDLWIHLGLFESFGWQNILTQMVLKPQKWKTYENVAVVTKFKWCNTINRIIILRKYICGLSFLSRVFKQIINDVFFIISSNIRLTDFTLAAFIYFFLFLKMQLTIELNLYFLVQCYIKIATWHASCVKCLISFCIVSLTYFEFRLKLAVIKFSASLFLLVWLGPPLLCNSLNNFF